MINFFLWFINIPKWFASWISSWLLVLFILKIWIATIFYIYLNLFYDLYMLGQHHIPTAISILALYSESTKILLVLVFVIYWLPVLTLPFQPTAILSILEIANDTNLTVVICLKTLTKSSYTCIYICNLHSIYFCICFKILIKWSPIDN